MGLRIRHIKLDAEAKPALDAQGREIELWSVDVPAEVEAEGGAAIDAYVAAQLAPAPTTESPED
jgi:hypothetical protein